MNYLGIVIFDIARIVICFLILYVWLGPIFLRHVAKHKGLDRIMYSWVAISGLIIILIFLLTLFNLYDFISLFFLLIAIPIVRYIWSFTSKGTSFGEVFSKIEHNSIRFIVKKIESIKGITWGSLVDNFKNYDIKKYFRLSFTPFVFLVAFAAALIRVIPAINSAAPPSRTWYFELEKIKNLSLQIYFGSIPEPKGLHSLINTFSTLTQVSPEMILHLLSGLTGFFLCIIIFWVIMELTRDKMPLAAIFGMSIYAFIPTLLLPVSVDLEGQINSISLALCFALPTAIFFIRNIRSFEKSPWFYVTVGIIATGLINIFVLLNILLPFLLFGLVSLRSRRFFKSLIKVILYLISVLALSLAPFVIYCLFNEIYVIGFFQEQLFNPLVFSFYPDLFADLDLLSTIYFYIGLGLLVILFSFRIYLKKAEYTDLIIFTILFTILSYIYSSYYSFGIIFIDTDQLNSFFALIISISAGIAFFILFKLFELLITSSTILKWIQFFVFVSFFGFFLIYQNGIKTGKDLPPTLPNGFFEAYYKIISERIPYTYATVGPDIDRSLAKNRHFFMNYNFFLNEYGQIDALYQQYLLAPEKLEDSNEFIPPASIFIFVEKPPYNSIQQGILFESASVMRDIEQWVSSYKNMENRTLNVYYESEDSVVYEIINREESSVSNVLSNIYSKGDGFGQQFLKK